MYYIQNSGLLKCLYVYKTTGIKVGFLLSKALINALINNSKRTQYIGLSRKFKFNLRQVDIFLKHDLCCILRGFFKLLYKTVRLGYIDLCLFCTLLKMEEYKVHFRHIRVFVKFPLRQELKLFSRPKKPK